MSLYSAFAALLVAYFALLVALSRWKSATVASPALQLVRAFFPSWKFFDDIGDVPTLLVRWDGGDWQPALPRPARKLRQLILNAEGNYLLAAQSLLQQLVAELEDADPAHPERVADSVAYELTRNLAQFELRRRAPHARGPWQFMLRLTSPDGASEDVLVSPPLELS